MGGKFSKKAKKDEGEVVEKDEEEQTLDALEEDLQAAQARLEAATERGQRPASPKKAPEPASPEKAPEPASPEKASEPASPEKAAEPESPREPDMVDVDVPDHKGHTAMGSGGTKNTSAKSDKEVGRERWLAKKEKELRVREVTKKSNDRLRKAARDRKFQGLDEDAGADDASPVKAAPEASKPKNIEPAYDSEVVKLGAQSLSERLKSLKDRTNDAERKAALVRVLTGGKANYYTP